MRTLPTLKTARLIMRPMTLDDGPAVQRLAGDRKIAATTFRIPHPYPDGLAEQWIAGHGREYDEGKLLTLGVTQRAGGDLVGCVSLMDISLAHSRAELGYWIGVKYWNRGYATEASRAIMAFGFEEIGLHRVFARHIKSNTASGRVMEKLGMTLEGCQRHQVCKWGVYEDMAFYGILKDEFDTAREREIAEKAAKLEKIRGGIPF